jgi:hypothetical protein
MSLSDKMANSTSDLGPKQAEFRSSGWARTGFGCLGVFCTLIGIVLLIGIVVGLVNGGRAKRLPALVAFGVVFLLGGIALLRGMKWAGRTHVQIHVNGLVLQEGANVIPCRWKEIVAVTEKEAVDGGEVIQEAMKYESRAFRLRQQLGEEIALKSYIGGLAELGDIVKRATLPHLLQSCQAELKQKRQVDFGPICLRLDGIQVQEDLLPWAEVAGVDRKGGWIRVQRIDASKNWRQVKLSDVPNAHVLIHMVDQRVRA